MDARPEPDDLRLGDGRRITIDSIHIMESTAGLVYAASEEVVWRHVENAATLGMPGSYGDLPTFVIPPVSVRRDAPVLPRWKVYARLIRDSLNQPPGPLGGGSQLVLVFYCDDIAGAPITELIGWQLAHLDERMWRQHADDWLP